MLLIILLLCLHYHSSPDGERPRSRNLLLPESVHVRRLFINSCDLLPNSSLCVCVCVCVPAASDSHSSVFIRNRWAAGRWWQWLSLPAHYRQSKAISPANAALFRLLTIQTCGVNNLHANRVITASAASRLARFFWMAYLSFEADVAGGAAASEVRWSFPSNGTLFEVGSFHVSLQPLMFRGGIWGRSLQRLRRGLVQVWWKVAFSAAPAWAPTVGPRLCKRSARLRQSAPRVPSLVCLRVLSRLFIGVRELAVPGLITSWVFIFDCKKKYIYIYLYPHQSSICGWRLSDRLNLNAVFLQLRLYWPVLYIHMYILGVVASY